MHVRMPVTSPFRMYRTAFTDVIFFMLSHAQDFLQRKTQGPNLDTGLEDPAKMRNVSAARLLHATLQPHLCAQKAQRQMYMLAQ